MKRFLFLLLGVALLTALTTGCGGGEKDKNKNSGLDRPAASKELATDQHGKNTE